MTDSPDSTLGSDIAAPARSSHRSRRLAIIAAVALVLIAGAVFVGVTNSGDRAGMGSSDSALCSRTSGTYWTGTYANVTSMTYTWSASDGSTIETRTVSPRGDGKFTTTTPTGATRVTAVSARADNSAAVNCS